MQDLQSVENSQNLTLVPNNKFLKNDFPQAIFADFFQKQDENYRKVLVVNPLCKCFRIYCKLLFGLK